MKARYSGLLSCGSVGGWGWAVGQCAAGRARGEPRCRGARRQCPGPSKNHRPCPAPAQPPASTRPPKVPTWWFIRSRACAGSPAKHCDGGRRMKSALQLHSGNARPPPPATAPQSTCGCVAGPSGGFSAMRPGFAPPRAASGGTRTPAAARSNPGQTRRSPRAPCPSRPTTGLSMYTMSPSQTHASGAAGTTPSTHTRWGRRS
jgi:hypothetical protein